MASTGRISAHIVIDLEPQHRDGKCVGLPCRHRLDRTVETVGEVWGILQHVLDKGGHLRLKRISAGLIDGLCRGA